MAHPKHGSIPGWMWAIAAALIALAAVGVWQAQRFSGEFALLRLRSGEEQARGAALESEQQRYQQALNIVAASATKEIELKPPKGAGDAKEKAPAISAYWNPQMGLALAADKIPQPMPGHVLQLWIVPQSGSPVSAGIFRPNASGQVLLVAPSSTAMGNAKELTITDEPAGGSAKPTASPAWAAPIPAK